MAKGFFRDCNIAISGNFGKDRDAISIKRWLDYHGGKFNGIKVEPGVTHLVCTESNYKNLVAAVQKADQLRIPIVTYDWLEDSLAAKHKYKASGKFLMKVHCKMSAAEKRARQKREREALRKDGKALPPHNPESAAGLALGFFDDHLDKLNSKPKRAKGKGPIIERHTIYDPLLQAKKAEKHDEDAGGDEQMSDGDEEASTSHSTTSSFDGTPSLESRSGDSAASTSSTPVRESNTIGKDKMKLDNPNQHGSSSKVVSPSEPPPTTSAAFANEPTPPSVRDDKIEPISAKQLEANHHLYRDKTSFVYDIKLLRLDLTKNSNERFHLRLYESHTSPHSYAVHLLYFNTRKMAKTPSVQAMGHIPEGGTTIAATGSAWDVAFKVWREVFIKLTGLKWEERLDAKRAGGIRRDMIGSDGDTEKYFKYLAPKAGEPRGIFPQVTQMLVVDTARPVTPSA